MKTLSAGLAVSLVACAARANTATPGAHVPSAFLLRNHSEEVVCEVSLAPAGSGLEIDRLGPAEVIPPGGGREWVLTPGRYDLRVRNCARTIVWEHQGIQLTDAGVLLTFRARQ